MRRLGWTLVVVAAATAAFSCDPRKFDDLADRTWYRHVDHPSALTGDFGVRVGGLALSDGMAVVALAPQRGVAVFTYEEDGSLASTVALEPPPPLLATDIVRDFADLGGGRLALGTADNILVYADGRTLTGATPVFQTPPAGVTGLGGRMAAGDVNADGVQDLVTISDNGMLIFIPSADGTLATVCSIDDGIGGGGALHSMTIGPWLQGSTNDYVALGLRAGTTTGVAVVNAAFFQNGTCIVDLTTGGQTGVDFVRPLTITPSAIVLAQFDGAGNRDLVVADAIASAVQVIEDAASPPVVLAPPPGEPTAGFGASITAGDFDGDTDEVLVGSPQAPVEGTANAGKVYVYQDGTSDVTVLYDTLPEDNQLIGRALGRATLGGEPILLVGGNLELLVYFKIMEFGNDPRFDDQ